MTAIHQQRRDNVERIVDLLMVIYDKKTPENQRAMFTNSVTGDATRCSITDQRKWIARLEIVAQEASND